MEEKKRLKYEKPVSIDMGRIAPVLGAVCSNGASASDGCIAGDDPHVVPACWPGHQATYSCKAGTTNTTGWCESGGSAGGPCQSGDSPLGKSGSGPLSRF